MATAPPFVLTDTSKASLAHGVKCVLYGRSGAGKTMIARTLPRLLYIGSEHGELTLKKYSIPATKVTSVAELLKVYTWLFHRGDDGYFQNVMLDGISDIAEVVLAEMKAKNKNGLKAYGETNDAVAIIARDFRNLPNRNVVITAKQEQIQDANGSTKFGPSMPSKTLSQALPYWFDMILQIDVQQNAEPGPDGKKPRIIRCHPDFQYDAKDRSDNLAEFEPADLSHIFAKALG